MHRILIGLGGNLPSWVGAPRITLEAALAALEEAGVRVVARSSWYTSAPVPASDQPWFVNGVVSAETDLGPEALLGVLHGVEAAFGRVREEKNGARTLDLDLLAHGNTVESAKSPLLPHPRLHERAFVMVPLAEIAPEWRHPVLNRTAAEILAAIPAGPEVLQRI
ncbi:MAG: 2-amino-4-hydroxy-6-hydroxymethyldihydropteridine diphosphokinase [Rhodospirillaceae bacterium]|nr:2-amino-4-hydroxy-6-hydroxymethyldihydropteridine diphosphokinase [Rhodospirillaceae bacterium]